MTGAGLAIWFRSDRPGTLGGFDVWTASRASTAAPFDPPIDLEALSSTADDGPNWISSDECVMYLTSGRSTSIDVFVAWR